MRYNAFILAILNYSNTAVKFWLSQKQTVIIWKWLIISGSKGSYMSPGKTWCQMRRSEKDDYKRYYNNLSAVFVLDGLVTP